MKSTSFTSFELLSRKFKLRSPMMKISALYLVVASPSEFDRVVQKVSMFPRGEKFGW